MLNFKNFQKIAEDEKTVTMRHEKGHEMRIFLKSLRPIEREQIKRLKMAEGGAVQKFAEKGMVDAPVESNSSETPNSSTMPQAAEPPLAGPVNQSLQSADPAQINVPQVPVTPNVLNPGGEMNPGAVMETGQAAIDLGQKVETQAAKAKAQYDQQYLKERQRLNALDAEHIQGLQAHAAEFDNFVKANPINPEAYGQSQTESQRVGTGIGLFLGGLGGQGHSNLALDFLNKQIDRNVQAQRENVANRRTVWGAYHDLYGSEMVANNMAKVAAIDMLTHQVDLTAAQLGTPEAARKAMELKAQKAIERSKLIQDAAVDPKALPGSELGPQTLSVATSPAGAAMASNVPLKGTAAGESDHILGPDAQKKYDQLKYNHVLTPAQIDEKKRQFEAAVQVDKSIDQIKSLWPQLRSKATISDWAAGKVDPHVAATIGGAAFGGGAAMSGYGLPFAGGAAALGAGAGEAAGHMLKGALKGVSGQQGTQYHTAANALTTQVGNALGEGLTPSEKAEIAKEFVPTWFDDDETSNDKLQKLIQKIKSVAKTGALKGMAND